LIVKPEEGEEEEAEEGEGAGAGGRGSGGGRGRGRGKANAKNIQSVKASLTLDRGCGDGTAMRGIRILFLFTNVEIHV
jgi:hypothetical protein